MHKSAKRSNVHLVEIIRRINMKKTYTQSVEEVLQDLGVGADGLTTAQAQERLEKYGPNKLKEAEKPTLLQRFLA